MNNGFSANTRYRVAELPQNKPTRFTIVPEVDDLKALAKDLGVIDLRKLRFEGKIAAAGKKDWKVEGQLGATVTQECVVTLDPVNTRIETSVERLFSAQFDAPTDEEYELTEDDNSDPLEEFIDLKEILHEELGLSLPLYPRADHAETAENVFTEPGKKAMTDEDTRPFAGLSALRDKLAGEGEN